MPDASPAGMDFRKFVVDETVGAAGVGGALEKVRGFDVVRRGIGFETDVFECRAASQSFS